MNYWIEISRLVTADDSPFGRTMLGCLLATLIGTSFEQRRIYFLYAEVKFRHASKMGKDLYRFGELLKSEEPFNFKQIYQSGELYKCEELYQYEEPFKSCDPKKTSELSGSELNSSASKEVQPDENADMANNLSQNRKPRAKGAIDAPVNAVSKSHINQGGINLGEPKDSVSANRLPIEVKILSIQLLFPSAQNTVVKGQAATGSHAGQVTTRNCAGRAAFACVPVAQVVAASFQPCQAAVVRGHHGQAAAVNFLLGLAVIATILIAVGCAAAVGKAC